ncbi:Insect cuticle protein [Nesidiocoris tenuis]|uniref:Insect cuticle protein n=1 Tax=Nesidiocoris tenuis TaxID=355587 RepID=A0ABN7A9E2_9HEMI|nr:Insect cuticle protein [Nesidiocoris tenuis]
MFLPILPVLVPLFIVSVRAKIDGSAAEGLMQIQRVLELSSEIAKAEDATVPDGSTAESKVTGKRESYALPDNLLLLVNNHIHGSEANNGNYQQGSYVTPVPDQSSFSSPGPAYGQQEPNSIQYQNEQLAQSHRYGAPIHVQPFRVPEHQSQGQAVAQQQYIAHPSPQEPLQQHHEQLQYGQKILQQDQQQYSAPQQYQQVYQVFKTSNQQYSDEGVPQSFAAYFAHPSNGLQVPPALTSQQQEYPTGPPTQLSSAAQGYDANPQQHYAIAAQQAAVSQHGQQVHPKQMLFVGGHPQTGSYTEAVIRPSGQYVANISPPQPESNGPQKLQINIHPQPFGLQYSYQDQGHGQRPHYVPLQILINNMAEPTKFPPGISPPGGPEQPRMPIYHYSPVPAGIIKDEHVPDTRIKSTYTPPNPHSDKYKDFPSSGQQSKPIPPPTSTMTFASAMPPVSQPVTHVSQPIITTSNAVNPLTSGQAADYDDDEFIKYDFGYRVSDSEHKVEFGKTESKKDGVTKGSYHVLLPDGRLQVVKYWSDHTGYHTDISYTVPGAGGKAR